ncbi:MAG TPA: hypothetical protein VH741_03965 [Candidatus Limnocylindrales bacterium]
MVVWLALVLAFGVLHAWVSAWWSLEVGAAKAAEGMTAQEPSR